jgi:alpha-glucosidase
LPLGEENLARSVDAQEEDPGSLLNFTRAMLALRKENGALRHGGMELLLADEDRLVFRRDADGNALLCMFNLSAKAAVWPKEFAPKGEIVAAVNGASIGTLPAYGALIIRE